MFGSVDTSCGLGPSQPNHYLGMWAGKPVILHFPPPPCSCMASGGGGHPSHLPITMPASSGGSLQTPDTSALFMSSLGGSGGGGPGGSGLAPTPLDQSQSFTSLEELLNVTGINSLELGQEDGAGLKKGEGDGVGSLQQIAKEVESSQGECGRWPL